MPDSAHSRETGLGLASEGFALGFIYAVGFVVAVALRQAPVDSFALAVPAVAFAGIGGELLRRFAVRLLPVLSVIAFLTGVVVASVV